MSNEEENRDEKLERRKRELEEELERYAQSGVSSPGLLRAARWLSRGLYLAMAAVVAFLLFSGWGRVSQGDYETAVQQMKQAREERDRLREERDGLAARVVDAEVRAARLEARVDAREEGVEAANRAQSMARFMLGLIEGAAPDAASLETSYRGSSPGDGRLGALALLAEAGGDDQLSLMRGLATASERPMSERIIAVRWLGNRKQIEARPLLQGLARGEGALAREAQEALARMEEE